MSVSQRTTTSAREVAERVADPELPMLTLADLGVLRDVAEAADGSVTVALTPTYSGCPAMAEMRADVVRSLHEAGYADVRVTTVLDPPWTSDWISEDGRRKLAEYGVAPPGEAPRGPVPLTLGGVRRAVECPRCGSRDTEETSRFSSTACKALWRCRACSEPFEQVKEI
ncbi:1,2-phenylacetyl-CoA epoxidase subunit PaaD [Actinomadura oligospora]|uniref:1,2-phenylacetyl-CoA epoxidase subunit PaaD n=1 Tax=Actinomadura oligospora TaxID=111804 RepID=UPI00047D91D6|nr:1,2-phenylacetyl-CoA epoxidase subunit PaaD [Actinomadura oligospora]